MLTVTFLGHQGWMFGSRKTHILVDPLLDESFGILPEADFAVYPPRRIRVECAPSVQAVFFTHEHEDHFQIASLSRLSRDTLVVLSSRVSSAARRIVEVMGFRQRNLDADEVLTIGTLELRTFAPDLWDNDCYDEWDVLPFSVRDLEHDGAFLSTVDIQPDRSSSALLPAADAPALVAWTNNFTSNHCLSNWRDPPVGTAEMLPQLASELRRNCPKLGGAAPTLVASGGGWSFGGDLRWLNRAFFPSDNEAIEKFMESAAPASSPRFAAPMPGETFVVKGRQVISREVGHPDFLRARPRSEWPERRYDRLVPRATSVPPLSASTEFTEADFCELQQRLSLLARAMPGSALFRALNSLPSADLEGKSRAFCLFAQTGPDGSGYALTYRPGNSEFVPASDPLESHTAGAICWAGDLLRLLRGRLSGPTFAMGRMLEWVRCKARRLDDLSLQGVLWNYTHPLRMPDEVFSSYEDLSVRFAKVDRLPGRPGLPGHRSPGPHAPLFGDR
jgi:hypothetical protein